MLTTVLRRAGGISIGTAIGQGIILASTPWLVRVYGPASFGLLALVITATNISIAIGCARFDLALPSAEKEDVTALSRLCMLIAAGAAVLATLIASAAAAALPNEGPLSALANQPALIGLCVFFAATFQAVSSALLRDGQISAIAILRAFQGILFVALALLSNVGLLWAQVLSFAVGLVLVPFILRSEDTDRSIAYVAAKYRAFAIFALPGTILDVVGYSLCIWVVTLAYGAAGSGELSQVQRIVGSPLMLASISLGQILLRQSADMQDDPPQLKLLIMRLLRLLLGGAAVAIVMLAIVGEPVLRWILGSKWDVSAIFIVAIAVAVFARASVSPLSAILATFRRLDLALRWQMLYFASAATLFTLASKSLPLDGFVVFYALHEVVLYLIYLSLIMTVFRKA